ncbi:MAG: tRNA (adenosine(37)-N6)-threonylcarbamoyltransferase complex dimerization subunit type 1 TsaB, partial [Planctomycetaceae bacterium]|nr:tRNA (adenosine(37)-N6)-threonylcarbamoyltransferase complex dimerization subunit type 1 TsaB [Planctomycetaceae bacterium]
MISCNVLAIETVDKGGSVAVSSVDSVGGELLFERVLPLGSWSAQTLAAAIDSVLREAELEPNEIGKVAVVTGPGSFTGLRIGIVTAKVFAYAVGADVVGVSAFEVAAFMGMLSGVSGLMSIGVNAQRGDVIAQDWLIGDDNFTPASDISIMQINNWLKHNTNNQPITFAGPAMTQLKSKNPNTLTHLASCAKVADESLFEPRASGLAKLAQKREPNSTVWTIAPIYSRPSAADEK